MTVPDDDTASARNTLVDDLIQRRIIQTPAVERAFRAVPRHAFLPTPFLLPIDPFATEMEETRDARRAYSDTVVAANENVSSVAPSTGAEQIEQLLVGEGMRVLHVGAGTGYYTAILAELVGEQGTVLGMEYAADLAELSAGFLGQAGYTNVTIREGDGAFGIPEAGPFDRILVSAAVTDIAPAWISQLELDGRLVLPLCHGGGLGRPLSGGVILTVQKTANGLWGDFSSNGLFAPLRGTLTPAGDDTAALADGLQRWRALEDFLRTHLPVCIAMKANLPRVPGPSSVPWQLETRNAIMWIQPN
ncbi:MAG: protein-L-isoaspartate O-methyltransferase [Candidatus Binatia bacterium]